MMSNEHFYLVFHLSPYFILQIKILTLLKMVKQPQAEGAPLLDVLDFARKKMSITSSGLVYK